MKKSNLILLWASLSAILCACSLNDEPQRPERSEYIKVYETSADKTVDNIQIPFGGVQDGKIHILSNVDLQWKYMVTQDASTPDWFKITRVDEIEPGHTVVTYDAESILDLNSLDSRSGKLSFSCPPQSLGKFLTVRQGYPLRFIDDFSGEPGQMVTITGRETFTTQEYSKLSKDYFDYISFNAWAETDNEFLSKNITLDITVSGGQFYDTRLATFRVNVPLGTAADKSNLHYLLIVGNDGHLSSQTKFIFSTANDDRVFVHIDNLAAYQVTPADFSILYDDDYAYDDDEGADWI